MCSNLPSKFLRDSINEIFYLKVWARNVISLKRLSKYFQRSRSKSSEIFNLHWDKLCRKSLETYTCFWSRQCVGIPHRCGIWAYLMHWSLWLVDGIKIGWGMIALPSLAFVLLLWSWARGIGLKPQRIAWRQSYTKHQQAASAFN